MYRYYLRDKGDGNRRFNMEVRKIINGLIIALKCSRNFFGDVFGKIGFIWE
jgi:hypothetical protein